MATFFNENEQAVHTDLELNVRSETGVEPERIRSDAHLLNPESH